MKAKEKNRKRLSMEEAADLAKKRLKMQEDVEDDSDDESGDGKRKKREKFALGPLGAEIWLLKFKKFEFQYFVY